MVGDQFHDDHHRHHHRVRHPLLRLPEARAWSVRHQDRDARVSCQLAISIMHSKLCDITEVLRAIFTGNSARRTYMIMSFK